jgi:hypothetical protein
MEGFEGLTDGFEVDEFEKNVEKVQTDLNLIETKKNEIAAKVQAPIFQDQEFIQTELRTLIMSARTVFHKVEQDIKIGADNRKIEVYAKLLESIGKQYTSLIELNKHIFDARVQMGNVDIENIGNNKISLSSEQLLDMINKAKEGSEMNKIDAHFEVEDGHSNK